MNKFELDIERLHRVIEDGPYGDRGCGYTTAMLVQLYQSVYLSENGMFAAIGKNGAMCQYLINAYLSISEGMGYFCAIQPYRSSTFELKVFSNTIRFIMHCEGIERSLVGLRLNNVFVDNGVRLTEREEQFLLTRFYK